MKHLSNKMSVAILLIIAALKSFAATSTIGELHFLSFNETGIDLALRSSETGQIAHDPEECGSTHIFRLTSSHPNYDALSGVLLTYYYSKRPVAITVSGCSASMPNIVKFESSSS